MDTVGDFLLPVKRKSIRMKKARDGQVSHFAEPGGFPVKVADDGFYHKISTYDGVPNYDKWMAKGWGKVEPNNTGATGGNPWEIPSRKGIGGRPAMPGDTINRTLDRTGREVPPKDTSLYGTATGN
jgi:hypothetical protein